MGKNKYAMPALFGMLATALIWGFAFVVVKNSLDDITTEYMLAFRFTVAAVGLALIFCTRLKKINLAYLKNGSVLGVLLFASYALQTYGCEFTTAGKNAFLTTIYVILVPFMAWFISKKKPDKFCVAAAVMGLAGIALISLGGKDFSNGFSVNIGDLLTLACGVGYALHMIYIDKYTEKQDPVLLTVLQLAVAAVLSWILALINGGGFPTNVFDTNVLISMLYLGLLSTMVAFLLQNVCQKYAEPSAAAIVLSFESVFGVAASIIFLGEAPSVQMIIGCVLMFVAVITVETKFTFLRKNGNRKKCKKNA